MKLKWTSNVAMNIINYVLIKLFCLIIKTIKLKY